MLSLHTPQCRTRMQTQTGSTDSELILPGQLLPLGEEEEENWQVAATERMCWGLSEARPLWVELEGRVAGKTQAPGPDSAASALHTLL